MTLTSSQLVTLKNDIAGDQILSAFPNNDDGNYAVAAIYNTVAVPDFWVWRTAVSRTEFTGKTSIDGTDFTWVGNGFITRAVGEQEAWRELFNSQDMANPSLTNVRQAIGDIFSGTGNAAANRSHLLVASRRKATRAEKLFATGTGTTATPALMSFEGTMDYQTVGIARTMP